MGVPVVTWPQEQVVSRQTYAFLNAIGLSELVASDAGNYMRIATELASDIGRLKALRVGMRDRMRSSPLCDVNGFVTQLEDAMWAVARSIAQRQ